MGPAEWALLLLLALIWGGSFLFGRIAVAEVPPMTVALARVALAALLLAAVVAATAAGLPRSLREWAPFLVMGALNNVVPFSLILWGQQEIGAGLASVLNATTPLFTALVAHLATKDERITGAKLAGLAIGVGGVAVLVGPSVLAGLGGHWLSELAVLGAALSYGCAGVYGRRFRGTPPLTSACCQLTASTVILAPLVLVLERPFSLAMPGATAIWAIVALAVLCTSVAYVIFFTIVRRAGATNVMLVTLLIPPSAILLGALVLGERLEASDLLGAGIIGIALLVIDGRVLGRLGGGPKAGA